VDLPLVKILRNSLNRGIGVSKILAGLLKGKRNSLPVLGFEPGLLDHPARSLVSVLFKEQISPKLPVFKVKQQLGLNTYILRAHQCN